METKSWASPGRPRQPLQQTTGWFPSGQAGPDQEHTNTSSPLIPAHIMQSSLGLASPGLGLLRWKQPYTACFSLWPRLDEVLEDQTRITPS